MTLDWMERELPLWARYAGVVTPPPASFEEIVAAEEAVGLPLPPSLRLLASVVDGLEVEYGAMAFLPMSGGADSVFARINDPKSWQYACRPVNPRVADYVFVARQWSGRLSGFPRREATRGFEPRLEVIVPWVPSEPIRTRSTINESLRRGWSTMARHPQLDEQDEAVRRRYGRIASDKAWVPGITGMLQGTFDEDDTTVLALESVLRIRGDLTTDLARVEGRSVTGVENYVDAHDRPRVRWVVSQ